MIITAFGLKCLYYSAWTFGEVAMTASGQAYRGKDKKTGKELWSRYIGVDILGVETSIFAYSVMEAWNCGAQRWLKKYFYFRITCYVHRILGLYMTYMVSAFWHGFYPMYFLFFILYAIITENYKDIYKLAIKYPKFRSIPALIVY